MVMFTAIFVLLTLLVNAPMLPKVQLCYAVQRRSAAADEVPLGKQFHSPHAYAVILAPPALEFQQRPLHRSPVPSSPRHNDCSGPGVGVTELPVCWVGTPRGHSCSLPGRRMLTIRLLKRAIAVCDRTNRLKSI